MILFPEHYTALVLWWSNDATVLSQQYYTDNDASSMITLLDTWTIKESCDTTKKWKNFQNLCPMLRQMRESSLRQTLYVCVISKIQKIPFSDWPKDVVRYDVM